jgi:hypothetical protein
MSADGPLARASWARVADMFAVMIMAPPTPSGEAQRTAPFWFRYSRAELTSSVHADVADGLGTTRLLHHLTLHRPARLGHSGGFACRPRGSQWEDLEIGARRPDESIAGRLQVFSSPCTHGPCVQTRRAVARAPCTPSHALWARASPHAMSRSMPPLTVSSAVESRRLTLRRKDR